MKVSLPIPPSVNHCYVRRRVHGRVMNVLSGKAAKWMERARDTCIVAMKEQGWECRDGEKVIVNMWVYWPDRRRRDAHNLLKLICDALEGSVCVDDRWMLTRIMDFDVDRENPRVEIEAERYEPQASD